MAILQASTKTGSEYTLRCTEEGTLLVQAITEREIEHASGKGDAWSFDSGERDIDAGDTMLFVRNNDDRPLVLDHLEINGSNVICTWEVYIGTEQATAAGGGAVLPTNLNSRFNGADSSTTAFYDETGHADGSLTNRVKTAISGFEALDLTGLILQKNHWIQINQETESTSGSVIVHCHFQDEIN